MATGGFPGISAPASRWVCRRKVDVRATARLFCFPYSGAGASAFRRWPGALGGEVEVCPVQLPGREARISEPPFRRMSELVPVAARALLPHLDKPFVFFGHSLGALVAFELARHLQAQGIGPALLCVSGHTAPHLSERTPKLHALPEPELVQELRRLRGTPEEVLQNEELRQLIFPTVRADFEICETYRYHPGEALRCPIVALGGEDDETVDPEKLDEWRQHTRAQFDARVFPGDHFFINTSAPLVMAAVARAMTSVTQCAWSPSSP